MIIRATVLYPVDVELVIDLEESLDTINQLRNKIFEESDKNIVNIPIKPRIQYCSVRKLED